MSERRRLVTAFATTTLLLAIALGVRPVPVERILAAYVLALAAVALASLVRVAHASAPARVSAFEHALTRRPEDPVRPAELVRTEREITLGSLSAGHLHGRLLPLLREAAAARLAAHHGVELERRPEAARRLLGDEAWELLRPDLAPPDDRSAPGLPLRRIRGLVDTLEQL